MGIKASILCNKCGLRPKYPSQGLCKECYFDKQQKKYLSLRTEKVVENLPGEIWKEIESAKGYFISDKGRIKTANFRCRIITELNNEQLLKPGYARKDSYLKIDLDKYNWRPSVHVLVATHFVPNPDNYPIVLHNDENKQNNCADNLRWGTTSQNNKDYYNHAIANNIPLKKLNENSVIEILNSKLTVQSLCIIYDVSATTIWSIKTGRNWNKVTGLPHTRKV